MTKQFYTEQIGGFEGPLQQMIRLVPDDRLDWRPADETMTVRQLTQHLIDSMRDLGAYVLAAHWIPKPIDLEKPAGKSKDDLSSELREAFADCRMSLENVTADDFANRQAIVADGTTPLKGTNEEVGVLLGYRHLCFHTMQLFCYLRTLGVEADTGTLYFGLPPGQFSTRGLTEAMHA